MKLESQVITKDQAKRLKELGINAEALWYWVYPINEKCVSSQTGICHKDWAHQIIQENDGDWADLEMAAAYGVAELGVLLPDVYADMQWYTIPNAGYNESGENLEPPNCFSLHIGETTAKMDSEPFNGYCYSTEAQARAAYLIMLLEEKSITPEYCNKRLLKHETNNSNQ